MTSSKYLHGSLIAIALTAGLGAAHAQTASETAPAEMGAGKHAHGAGKADGAHMNYGHHGGHGMMRQIMQRADANGDRAITQAEIDTFRADIVANADASGEGDISLGEFEKIYLDLTRERMVDAFQKLDADGDGAVTQAEMDRRFGDIVERVDRNGDGQLDRQDRKGGRPARSE